MAYHGGCLHTQVVAHREGRADSDGCLLCGEKDTRQHAVSGCRAIRPMATNRHHKATRLLAKEVVRGRHGNGLLMMDAGSQERREEDGIRAATSIPDWVLPRGTEGEQLRRLKNTLKPDILLQVRGARGQPDTLKIIEVKYCKDTDKSQQEEWAAKQHKKLIGLMEEAGHKVEQETILLGVGGTIYKDLQSQLENMGVAKPRALKLMHKLSAHAVTQMQQIVHVRRALEQEAMKAVGKWKAWGQRADPWARRPRRRKDKRGEG